MASINASSVVLQTTAQVPPLLQEPEPFDDMFVHPLEVTGYYVLMYSPCFLIPSLHAYAYLCYMVVMGVTGICDHSGVKFAVGICEGWIGSMCECAGVNI